MTKSKHGQTAPAEGVLSSVIGYHIATARVITQGLFMRHIGEPFGLKGVEYTLLMLIKANGGLTPKQLSRMLSFSGPNLSMLLDRVQGRGLVERVRSDVDKRSQKIMLTAAGEALADQLESRTPEMEAELQQSLSPAERAMLIELLLKVSAHAFSHPSDDS